MIVFFGGSRSIRALPAAVTLRIDRAIAAASAFVIGDAAGVDAMIQHYLNQRGARNVSVYCAAGGPRNNVGGWPVIEVAAPARKGTAEYFTAKDRAMAETAGSGLVVWDGASKGTMLQVWRLARDGKYVAVYDARQQSFVDVRSEKEWSALLDSLAPHDRSSVMKRMRSEAPPPASLFNAA